MKKYFLLRCGLFILFLFVFTEFIAGQKQEWKVSSPDKNLQISLTLLDETLSYKVTNGDELLIGPSALGIVTEDENFSSDLAFVKQSRRVVNDNYILKTGKRKINHATANESVIRFKNDHAKLIEIHLRAYNDGIAFRYHFPGNRDKVTVKKEITSFTVPENGKAWMQNYALPAQWDPSYETAFTNGIPVGSPAKDSSGWAMPALFNVNDKWFLIAESDVDRNYCGTHFQQYCEYGIYKIAFPTSGEANGIGNVYPSADLPFHTPWRVIIMGKKLSSIVESNLIHHLATPNKIGDDSWVKPGRSSWSWWSDHPSSKDFNKLKRYVDLARDMHWEYSLVDANWNIMQGGNIEELIKYAEEKKVGLSLWYNSGGPHNTITEQPRNIMNDPVKRKKEFKKLRAWGIKAVKVDFFNSDKQNIIQLYHDILQDAAREKLMVDFHGCTMPRGWSRTYPNLVTMEGIRGAEQIGWDTVFAKNAAMYNTINVFTRNVVGPMDYTPVTFSDTRCCPHTTTNAHELALSVLFESGIQHFADSDSSYQSQTDEVKKFLSAVPNTWDETKFIEGEPGKEVIIARRKGNDWYIAGVNGENLEKKLSFTLNFLNHSLYKTKIFSDGDNAREIKTSEEDFKKDKPVSINVLPKGGFIVVLTTKN